jgi:hypothetical protein
VQACVGADGNAAAEVVPSKVSAFKACVVCNGPDNLLYEFSAKLQYKGEDLVEILKSQIPITITMSSKRFK